MVAFVTFFLGLHLGSQVVEVAVTEEVAAVRIELDEQLVGTMVGEPWQLVCDFGTELVPHKLVAVAVDAAGSELDRAERSINLPRQPAEATIALEGGEGESGRWARISWESVVVSGPPTFEVTFDGRRIPAEDPEAILLPPHDPEQLHFLRAELDFAGGLSSVVELTFGGAYADRVNAELTAVPVVVDKGVSLPSATSLDGWFFEDDRPLRVVALEQSTAQIVMVRDPATQKFIDLEGRSRRQATQAMRRRGFRRPRSKKSDWRLLFVWPISRVQQGRETSYDVFPETRELRSAEGDLNLLLHWIRQPLELQGPLRLADAVAVAGLTAAARRSRRVLVLLIGDDVSDKSVLRPTLARRYLEKILVPLEVWTTAEETGQNAMAWGEPRRVSSAAQIEAAWRGLLRSLERQHVVWVEGSHLPHRIRLSKKVKGIHIAG